MHWIDWVIVAVPLFVVVFIATRAQKYVRGVADFLAAGRVAGRYVLAVSAGEASMGLISLVGMLEVYYNSGLGYTFWNSLYTAVGTILMLFGYCIYRFRETRALTMGQFLEMRYNRSFRIMAAFLQSFSGVINYAIFPAVGARFLIYFCDLPLHVDLLGLSLPTFGLLMAAFLSLAVFIVSLGGQITIMVTDCVQGILGYPLYAIILVYLLIHFSWTHDIAPTLLDRPTGESLLNPFAIEKLRSFNLFFILTGILANVVNRMSWSGNQGYNVAALNAHEQKMGGVLGMWRAGFTMMVIVLLAVSGYTFLNNARFAGDAEACRRDLAVKVVEDVVPGDVGSDLKAEALGYIETGEAAGAFKARIAGAAAEDSREPLRDAVKQAIASEDPATAQSFGTIFGQMRVPVALRHMFPVGLMGIFCALCIFMLVSTDTTYLHSWGSIIVQDLILPIRGRPLTPHQQLRLLRLVIAGVAAFAFFFSYFFAQIDFIMMFFAITGAIWAGGSGPCIVGGLYWKRGTTAGAFTSLIVGSSMAVTGIVLQKLWVPTIYPWLVSSGLLERVTRMVEGLSHPLEPFIMWRVTPDAFPINSMEIYFMAMLASISLYVVVSLLTCREPFNMDRLLHRGKYRREGEGIVKEKLTLRVAIGKLVGINSQYTRGDKVLAWFVFFYSVVWILANLVVLSIWNALSPWPDSWWVGWSKVYYLILPGASAVVSVVWFTIGGTVDLRRLFQRLAEKDDDVLDDGRVVGHVSAADVSLVEQVDHVNIEEAHVGEEKLKQALEKEKHHE